MWYFPPDLILSHRGTVISTPCIACGSAGRTLLTVSSVIMISPSYKITSHSSIIGQNLALKQTHQDRLTMIQTFAITTSNTTVNICLVSQWTVLLTRWRWWAKSRLLHLAAIIYIKDISTKVKNRAFCSRQIKWINCSLTYQEFHEQPPVSVETVRLRRSDYGFRRTLAWWSLEKTFLTSSFRQWICPTFSEFSAFFLTFSLTSWYPDDLKVISSEINVWRDHKIDAIYSAFGVKKTYYQSEPSHYEKFSFLLVKILNSKKCLCIQKNFGIKIIKIKLINICAIITVIITDLWLEAYSEWSLFDSSCYIDHIIWWTYIMLHTNRKSIVILS